MKKYELDRYLQNKIPKAILLYGDNIFLIDYYSKLIQRKIGVSTTMYYGEYSEEDTINILKINNLFGDKNLVVAKISHILRKEHFKNIIKILKNNQNSYFIVEFHKSSSDNDSEYASKCKDFASMFKDKSLEVLEVRFFPLNFNDALPFMQDKANAIGMQIDISLLKYIFDLQNGNLSLVFQEMEKLSVYEDVTREIVVNNSCLQSESKIEMLVNLIFLKNGNILRMLEILSAEGVTDIEICSVLSKYFLNLFKINAVSKKLGMQDIRVAIGYAPPKYIAELYNARSLRLSMRQYLEIFDILNALRVHIISGKKDFIGICLFKLQNIL